MTLAISKLVKTLNTNINNIVLDTLAFFAGLLMISAFAPYGYWYITFFSLSALLFIWLKTESPYRGGFRGLLFGFGLYGIGLHWFMAISDTFSTRYEPIIRAIILGIYFLLACYPAVLGIILIIIKKQLSTLWMIILFPCLWVLFENLRSLLFTGLSLYQPSYAFVETPLAGFASIGGELLVTLIILLCISLFILFLYTKLQSMLWVLISFFSVVWLLGSYINSMTWGDIKQSLHVRVIHGAPNQRIKFRRYYALDTMKQYLNYSSATPQPDIVIWPESSLAHNFNAIKKHLTPRAEALQKAGTNILLGGYINHHKGKYNTILHATNTNNRYNKRHLIPFGEYAPNTPLININDYVPHVEMGTLAMGEEEQETIKIQNIKFAPAICYEIIFGSEFKNTWKNTDVLLHASDLSWFKNSWAAEQLMQVAIMRVKESAKPLLSSTNYGITAVINSHGKRIISYSSSKKSAYIDSKILIYNSKTLYSRFGNWIVIFISIAYVLLFLFWHKKYKQRETSA